MALFTSTGAAGVGALAAKAAEAVKHLEESGAERLSPGEATPEPAEFEAKYTCFPMTNYMLGRFVFEKGTMTLRTEEDVAEFEKLWKSPQQPAHLQRNVTKVGREAADERVRAILAAQGGMQTGMSTTANNNPSGGPIDPASTDSMNIK